MAVTTALSNVGAALSVYDNPADLLFEKDNIPKLANLWSTLHERKRKAYDKPPSNDDGIVNKFRSDIESDSFKFKNEPYREEKPVNQIPKLNGDVLIEYCGEHKLSTFQQFRFLFTRNMLQTKRDKVFFYGRYIAFFYSALLIAIPFQGKGLASEAAYFNTAMLYFCTNALLAAPALMAVMQAERNFSSYIRENINGWYSPAPYYMARSCLEWILQTSSTFVFIIVAWLMTKQNNPAYSFPLACVILLLQSVCCYHFMFIPSLFLDGHTNFQLPFLLSTIQTMLGGYVIPPNNLPHVFYYLAKVNFGLYSYLGLMKIVYSPFEGNEFELTCETSTPILCNRFPNGTSVLKANNIKPGPPDVEIGIIIGFLVAFLVLGLPAMNRRTKGAKNQIARITSNDRKANVELVKKTKQEEL